uniref:Uncharacterized protein n=1 Tax=Octopus bimaculoides TaxID=37653 RepID=A0A0L8I2A7_OCTBM
MNASEKAQVASTEIAKMIALHTKLHTLTKSITLPTCRKMVKTMLGDEAKQEISKILISNNTIHRRIMDLSADIEETVQNKLQNSEFALQVDESTDISNKAQLLTFIHFIDGNQIRNQFFCCEEMLLTTRGKDIFDILSPYLVKWNLSWNSCVGICTDGAPSMISSIKGFVSLVQQQNPNVIHSHCFIHREVLVSKTIPIELKQVLNQVVEMVNYIKSRPLMCCLYEQICVDVDFQHKRLLLHTKFSTLYLCKLGFSTFNDIKSPKRERFHCIEEEMMVCHFQMCPNIEKISKKHQVHVSH